MTFSDARLERYSRHIILKEVGVAGQRKLLGGKVLVIGAGLALRRPCTWPPAASAR